MTGPVECEGRGPAAEEIAEHRARRAPIKRDARGRFLAGHAGLKWGARSIGPVDLRDALQADWRENGAGCIERIRREQPERYLEIMIGILPRRWGGKGR